MLKIIKYELIFEIVCVSFGEVFMIHASGSEQQVFVSVGPHVFKHSAWHWVEAVHIISVDSRIAQLL
jgi:hypothetical protein